jgi:cytochrome P450
MGAFSALFPTNSHPQTFFTEMSRKYNLDGIFYLDLWPFAPSQVILSDPSLLEQVTVTKPLPQHKFADDFLAPIIGRNSIATANGPVWKELHNTLAPAFAWSAIRGLTSVAVEECEVFREALDQKAATGEIFSLEELGSRLTFDVIARAMFNVKLHAQTTGSAYLDDLKEMVTLANTAVDITAQINPVSRVKTWWKRQTVMRRLHSSIRAQIQNRFNLLIDEGVVPRKKDPDSILDLTLRERVAKSLGKEGKLSDDDMQMLVTK